MARFSGSSTRLIPRIALLLVLLLLAAASAHEAQALTRPPDGPGTVPLAQVLNPDGTLNLPAGVGGSYDARGWALASGANEAPRFVPSISGDEKWIAGFGPAGVNNWIYAVVSDGAGNIYVGGDFTAAGTTPANRVAKWNGTTWSALGYGLNAKVRALAWDSAHNLLYAGGLFQFACANAECGLLAPLVNNIAKWDGAHWLALSNGVNGEVDALALGNTLYVGGVFTGYCNDGNCGAPMPANHIAQWNGTNWGALLAIANGVDNTVYALAWDSDNSRLYVGGDFTMAGLVTVNHVARWDAGGWSALGHGLDDGVLALAWSGTGKVLYVGGSFTNTCSGNICPVGSPGLKVNRIARYWPEMGDWGFMGGSGVTDAVRALGIDASGNVYAGGWFTGYCDNATCAHPLPANHVAKWTIGIPGSWAAVGSGFDDNVVALLISGGQVYAGGWFDYTGNTPAGGIAKLGASAWSPLNTGNGIGGEVWALAADAKGNVYAGGMFHTAGAAIARNVARWNGASWSALDYGLRADVWSLVVDKNGNLYAGGGFSSICQNLDCTSTTPANHIAKWDGSHWSAVGLGVNLTVAALAFDKDGLLYAGGSFANLCANGDCSSPGAEVNHIAKWDGAQWTGVGFGFDGDVNALATTEGGVLYAGGAFTHYCGAAGCGAPVATSHIARWNGHNWFGMGNGLSDDVNALAWDGINHLLYAGGAFLKLCGNAECNIVLNIPFSRVAKWDGAAWDALGNGVNGAVKTLALSDQGVLYAGGDFTSCGDLTCTIGTQQGRHIAQWSGTSWSPLGSGTGPFGASVRALAWRFGATYVGGSFGTAGGDKASASFAQYGERRMPIYAPLLVR